MLTFEQALGIVVEKLSMTRVSVPTEFLPLAQVRGRILAEDVASDRDYPPFNRSMRDGYAVRSVDLNGVPTVLECVGEARAGEPYRGDLGGKTKCCVRIMTGAPVPQGTDAVVMVEQTRADCEGAHKELRAGTAVTDLRDRVEVLRAVSAGENVVRRGSEVRAGSKVLSQGRSLGAGEIGLLASIGRAEVKVFRQPTVAIIATGDEVVRVDQQPEWFQIRNANAATLGAQVAAAGGVPRVLDIAPDRKEPLRRLIEEGLRADLLLLSGGVSVGEYDLVEQVLSELGAEFYFQSVAIRPGKPVVFGRAQEKFFFGLPGNPVSTFVTFELFARPAIALSQGAEFEGPIFLRARLGKRVRQKAGLTTFMPARVGTQGGDPVVNLVGWQGSGDLVGVAAANCFLVIHSNQTELSDGDWVDVLRI